MNVQSLYDNGKFKEVIEILKDQAPDPILAFAYQKTKQWELGMNVWNALLVQSPENADYYNERGVCKFNLRFKHAIQDFNKAVDLEPSNAYFYSCRAYIRDKIGDTEGSVEDYTKALELDPEDAITLNNLGLAEQKLGYTARARERFKDSDDLLGVKSLDTSRYTPSKAGSDLTENGIGSLPKTESKATKPSIWREFKKMLTRDGFKDFWKDLRK
jgi:tetratricopeptide (TPR) repeat protein